MKHTMNELSRREFAGLAAKSFLGVSLGLPMLRAAGQEPPALPLPGPASRVIYLYMSGGMSHLDTLDPKTDSEVRGPLESIATSVPGIRVSAHMEGLARCMHKAAIVRSMSSTQGAHDRGRYLMRTGYARRGTIRHPSTGAWTMRLAGRISRSIPGYVTIGADSRHPGCGFFESSCAPLPIGDPRSGLQNSRLPSGITQKRLMERLDISRQIDAPFHQRYGSRGVRDYVQAYREALSLIRGRDLLAFDISKEPEDLRERYGDSSFGQGCLLARRLAEHDVRYVEVNSGGWDTHQNNFERVEGRARELDRALSALLLDLDSRGLLESTLVVVATEFGRTPRINQNRGRDHYPKAFSCLLAGGGIAGGQVHGRTDPKGMEVVSDRVSISDFNATIAHALGLPQDRVILSDSGRPFTVADKGVPVAGMFG